MEWSRYTIDITVLEEQTGVFAFKDSWPAKRLGTKRLDCVLTIRDGKIVYERGPVATGGEEKTRVARQTA